MREILTYYLGFLLALAGGIALHELAHAVGARLVGLRAAFCGVGYSQGRKLHFGRGPTRYFVGPLPTNGLTLIIHDGLRFPPHAIIFSIAAGPLANLVAFALFLPLDLLGLLPAFVARPIWLANFALSLNLLPFAFGAKDRRLRSDGMIILHYLRHRSHLAFTLGAQYAGQSFFLKLSEEVESRLGQVACHLLLAQICQAIGAKDEAGRHLDKATELQQDAPLKECLPQLSQITRVSLGHAALDPAQVEALSRPSYRLLLAGRQLREGQAAVARTTLESLRDDPSGEPFLWSQAEAMLLLMDQATLPPAEIITRARDLLRLRGRFAVTRDGQMALLTCLCQAILTTEGEDSATFRRQLKRLTRDVCDTAAHFPDADLRERYVNLYFTGDLTAYRPEV